MSVVRVDKVPYSVAEFGRTLTHDLAYGVPSALQFFPARNWQEVASRVATQSFKRGEVAGVLERDAQQLSAPPQVFESINALQQPGTLVVATGQQAGLLGGPLYSLHKALTAIKLARQYTQESNGSTRVVPIFWVAGDDHDLAEIDHADLIDVDGAIARLNPIVEPDSQGRSACDIKIDYTRIDGFREQLSGLLNDDTAANELAGTYTGRDFENAFAALMTKWLGPLGLIVVKSSLMRRFSGQLLLRDLNEYDVVSRLIQEAAVKLQIHRYEPGFTGQSRVAPHFFIASDPHRIRAHIDPLEGGTFQERSPVFAQRNIKPQRLSKQELSELIAKRTELFSASAALRPVVQQYIFPVVTAVLGPGEIAYWSQLKAVHDHFGITWPVVVPRATITLIDAIGEKAMRKLSIDPGSRELFLDFDILSKIKLAGGRIGGGLDQRIKTVLAELDAMEVEVNEADGGLKPLFEKSKARIAHELSRIAEKTKASINQREGAGINRLRYLSSLVRPKNLPQERVLSTAQFIARFPTLTQDLIDAIDLSAKEHLIVTLI